MMLEQEEIFIVHAHHDTGHGEASTVFAVVTNLTDAIKAARLAEEFGFQFYGDTYVAVSRCQIGSLYHKGSDDPCVFVRRHYLNNWTEEWFDEGLRKEYEHAA